MGAGSKAPKLVLLQSEPLYIWNLILCKITKNLFGPNIREINKE